MTISYISYKILSTITLYWYMYVYRIKEIIMEDKIADLYLQLQEVRSCIIILQKAIENESEEIGLSDINNYLTIALDKTNNVISVYDSIQKTLSTGD